jgi:hypothetical protein
MLELDEVINANIKAFSRNRIYTAIPAKIENVSLLGTQQVIDASPSIRRRYKDNTTSESPPIQNVPVIFPSGGGGILSFPLKVGDTVLLVFSMRSMEEWLYSDGSLQTPVNARHHDISDAIAIPCLYPVSKSLQPNTTDVELKFKGLSFTLEESGDITLANDEYSLKLKSDGEVLHSSGARITAGGDFVTAAGVSLDGHTHDVVIDSGSSAGTYESETP